MECGFANVSAAPGDFGSRVPSPPECFDLSDCFRRQDRLATEPNPFVQGEPDAVHLPLAANVILEFGNESEVPMMSLPVREVVSMLGSSITLKETPFSASSETMR